MKTIICNWKMNPETFTQAKSLFTATKKLAEKYKNTEVVVAPPAIFLRELVHGYRGTRIEFAAQNVYQAQNGSHTGETSPAQIHDAHATYTIIGHAERRAMGDTDADINAKVLAAFDAKLSPIIAVGEHERDEGGEYISVVREQITSALVGLTLAQLKRVTIAYEPVWAIGAPKAPEPSMVHQMMLLVKKILADTYGEKVMKHVAVVYGGSVNQENAEGIFAIPGLNGVLLGRAGLDPYVLEAILQVAHNI